jgi:hypothetical protein
VFGEHFRNAVCPMTLWILTIIPIKQFYFVMERLLLVVDGHLNINVLLSGTGWNGYSDMGHIDGGLMVNGYLVNGCLLCVVMLSGCHVVVLQEKVISVIIFEAIMLMNI